MYINKIYAPHLFVFPWGGGTISPFRHGLCYKAPLVPSGPLVYKHILVHYGQPCIYIIRVILRTNTLDVLNSHDIKILINIYKPILIFTTW